MIVGTRVFGSHLMAGSVEEGEASCYYKENGVYVDPDTTLSYMDEKIERFLGHFKKDFEGGVSDRNLGSRFGGYGSFLPTYEYPPSILPHQKNQLSECNAAPSPDNVPSKGSSRNPKAPPPERPKSVVCNTISSHNTKETSASISGRVDSCFPSSKVQSSCPSKVEASSRLGCPMNKRLLKVRIKLGSVSTGLKNAAIYSDLGLDDSTFSSSKKSSDVSEGMLPISQCPPDESPSKIIEEMTSFPVPNGALISPLHDSLLALSRKEKPFRETKPVLLLEDKKDGLAKLVNETKLKQNGSTLGTMSNAYLDPQKKKLSYKATLHKTDTDKGSLQKEKPEIVDKKKLEVPQTAGGKIASSSEKGFEFRSEASKGRKDTGSDTSELENRSQQLKSRKNRSLNGLSNPPNQLRNSMDQSSSDQKNLVDAKNRGRLKEKSIDRDVEGGEGMPIAVNQVSDKSACTKKRKLKDRHDDQNSHKSALREPVSAPVLSKKESCEGLKKKKKCNVTNDFAVGMEENSRDKEPKMQNKKIIHKQTPVVKVSPAESISSSPITSSLDQSRLCNNHMDDRMDASHKKRKKVFPDKQFCTENKVSFLTSNEKDKSVLSDVEKVKASDGMSKRSKKSTINEPEADSYHVERCPNEVGEIERNIPRKHDTMLTKKEKIHVDAEGLKSPQNLKGHDAEDQSSGASFQSNGAVRLQMKQSRDECKEEPSRLGGDSLRVSSKAGISNQLIADAPRSDAAVESKTLRDLGNAGNASNLDRTKSCNQTACNTLKEAKKLRDNADSLKSAGFSFESNELYFQSALKYLHGAFLQETLNNASGKHGDMTHMKYYGITAELCEICALEYESRGEMAAAALTFKCIEVAYLRIVYHKQSSVNGDRLKMQSVFRTIMQGESPSSSASCVDNLINKGGANKATSDEVGGSNIWNSRNCASFARVLDYVCFTNSAMEASRKSQNAFMAASSRASEGKHVDYVASVKKVIDFSFQDVGEFVRLVRVATQTITLSSFRIDRD